MNVIELAREVELLLVDGFSVRGEVTHLERFATLVRNASLEEAADICDRVNSYDNPMTAGDCADAIRVLKGEP